MMEQIENNITSLEAELQKVLLEKAETELDIHRGELMVKKINALANLEKSKVELMKLQLESKRVEMEERRLSLEEIQSKYNIASDLARKSDKIQRAVSKTMLGIFPKEDKQVLGILEASQKIAQIIDK